MLVHKFVMIFEQLNRLHFGGIKHMFLNYKLQAPNYKQTTNHKLQITNKEVSLGQILNAFGEEQKMDSVRFYIANPMSRTYETGYW
jgi:hypothetical protein